MPSACPKCRRVLEQDEICCSQVRYTWRCRECHKLTTGLALPYGKCFLCGGELEIMEDRELGDAMRYKAIREAVQFELNAFHFYKLARERAADPLRRQVLERLYEAELDHLHELEAKYHAHLDRAVIDLAPEEQKLLADWLFRDLPLGGDIRGLYTAAVEMERRTREHFRKTAEACPPGLDRDLYLELASEEDEHIAMLETELEQL